MDNIKNSELDISKERQVFIETSKSRLEKLSTGATIFMDFDETLVTSVEDEMVINPDMIEIISYAESLNKNFTYALLTSTPHFTVDPELVFPKRLVELKIRRRPLLDYLEEIAGIKITREVYAQDQDALLSEQVSINRLHQFFGEDLNAVAENIFFGLSNIQSSPLSPEVLEKYNQFRDGEIFVEGESPVSPPSAEPPVVPPETGGEENPPSQVIPTLPDFINNVRDFKIETLIPVTGIVAATSTVLLTTTLLSAGKDLLERTGFIIGGIIPKKRRYWGLVYDVIKSQGIPFAVIRVYAEDMKLLSTTVSDIDGRYGIPVSESGTYTLEVKASGYESYNKSVFLAPNTLQEIVENIPLNRSNQRLNPLRSFFAYYMTEILIAFRIIILALMVSGFIYSIYVFMQFQILLNLLVVLLYFGLFALNLYQEIKHRRNVEGRVVDLDTRTGLPNTMVILYGSTGAQEDVRLTNLNGIAKLRAKSGTYQVQALRSGYTMSDLEVGKTSLEIKVDERGYLTKAIFMRKS